MGGHGRGIGGMLDLTKDCKDRKDSELRRCNFAAIPPFQQLKIA
jgi:hypothetical protein